MYRVHGTGDKVQTGQSELEGGTYKYDALIEPTTFSHQLLLSLTFIACGHHSEPLVSGIPYINRKHPYIPEIQLISQQLNWSAKSHQLS